MVNQSLLLTLVMVLITGACKSQKACFNSEELPGGDFLKGDIHSIILDDRVSVNNPSFEFTGQDSKKFSQGLFLTPRFSINGMTSYLGDKSSKIGCTASALDEKQSKHVFICDSNKILIATLDKSNMKSTNIAKIDASGNAKTCHSVVFSSHDNNFYAACQTITQSLVILKIDASDTPAISMIQIEQSEGQQLAIDLRLMADVRQSTVYVWESDRSAVDGKSRIRVIRGINATESSRLFAVEDGTLKGAVDGKIVDILDSGNGVFIVIQKAKEFIGYVCEKLSDESTEMVCKGEGVQFGEFDTTSIVMFRRIDPALKISLQWLVYFASENQIVSGTINSAFSSFTKSNTIDIQSSKIAKVESIYFSENDVYLQGLAKGKKGMSANSRAVLKFSRKTENWSDERYIIPTKLSPSKDPVYSFVVQDDYNRGNAYFIGVEKDAITAYLVAQVTLILNTLSLPKVEGTALINIKCISQEDSNESHFSFTLQDNLHDRVLIRLQDTFKAYTGSKQVYLPLNSKDIEGNGLNADKNIVSYGDVEVNIDFARHEPTFEHKPEDVIESLSGLEHIGESYFVAKSSQATTLFKASQLDKHSFQWIKKNISILNDIDTKTRFVKASAMQGAFIGITTRDPAVKPSEYKPKTILYIKNIETEENILPATEYELFVDLAEVRSFDGLAHIMLIGRNKFHGEQSIYYLKFNLRTEQAPSELIFLASLGTHICPTQLSWSPRGMNGVMISSQCGANSQNNHVYQFNVSYEEPKASRFDAVFKVEGTENFSICSQARLVNIIDKSQNEIYSFDTITGQNTKLYLPFKDLGMILIKTFTCNQDNSLLQLIGCKDSQMSDCYLLTYRGNLAHIPYKRLHSMVKISSNYDKIASSYNSEDDLTMTLLASSSTRDLQLYSIYIDGPHVIFDASKVTESMEVNYSLSMTYPTYDHANKTVGQQTMNTDTKSIILEKQLTEVSFVLIDADKKAPANGSLINLEEYIEVVGPYHSFGKMNTGTVTINDRLSKSNKFNKMNHSFDDIVIHKDFFCGYVAYRDSRLHEGIIYAQGSKLYKKMIVATKVNMYIVEKDDATYFFVHSVAPMMPDKLHVMVEMKEGGLDYSWEMSLMHGFNDIKIVGSEYQDGFILSGYNNEREFLVYTEYFRINHETGPRKSDHFEHRMTYNIADFELVYLGDNTVLVIAAKEYSNNADFILLSLDENHNFKKVRLSKQELIPGVRETHEDIAFACIYTKPNTVQCVSSGKNMYSYVSEYQLDLDDSKQEFIKSAVIATRLRNLVNLKPIYVTFSGNFVVFLAKNNMPLPRKTKPTPSSFFTDKYVCLVYKVNCPIKVEVAKIPARDVYKILTVDDMGINQDIEFSRLKPRIDRFSDGTRKLVINIGAENKSLTVFNLDPLSMVAPQGSIKNSIINLNLKTLLGSSQYIELGKFVKDSEVTQLRKKSALLITVITIAIVLIFILIFAGVIVIKKGNGYENEDLNTEETDRSSKTDDSANYTKF